MIRTIETELTKLGSIREKIQKSAETYPKGSLRCAINKGCCQYYSGKTYLGADKRDYARQIAQRDYCLRLDKKIAEYQKLLEELKVKYENEELEEIYKKLHPGRKQLVEPLVRPVSDIISEFEKLQYEGKEFGLNDKTEYYTIKGERVRSKSEKIIADELHRYNIPYKYEMPIKLRKWNKNLIFYPDFTVLNKRTGKKWIIEHFGMMDNPRYYENVLEKLEIYEKNNLLIGRDLLIFHESANVPLNTMALKEYIVEYLC